MIMKFTCVFGLLAFPLIAANFTDYFPNNFLIGFSTASYQIEGAWNEDGKGENVWDRLVHTKPTFVTDKSNGDIACDSYHKFREDVQILKNIGADIYRFSISWSRILPYGDISKINKAGVLYYNNLINQLLVNGIQPMITLFHWDLPQPLQDLGGWTNPVMIEYFEDYARLAFQIFGEKVKWWITFNEPYEVCYNGYGKYNAAPGLNMTGIADYLCGHTIIKAHARVYHIYHEEFSKIQKGLIGITLNGGWNQPLTDTKEDKEAAETSLEFEIGWFLHPVIKGDYPHIMRKRVNINSELENRVHSRLPYFSDNWKSYIKGTLDFLGVNHYTTYLISTNTFEKPIPSFDRDVNITITQNSSWPDSAASWLKVEPTGFRKKLNWLKNYTCNIPVFVTENGYADRGILNDLKRINYHILYLKELLKAIYEDKCNVIGYNVWSMMDNFEWLSGYTVKFGIYYVDFEDHNRPRLPKASSKFFQELLMTRKLPSYSKKQVVETKRRRSSVTQITSNYNYYSNASSNVIF